MTALWGSTFAVTALGLRGYAPEELIAARLLLGASTLLIPAALLGHWIAPSPGHLFRIILLGLFGYGLPFYAIAWAQQTVPSGVAAIFLSTMPLFILLLARIVLREMISTRKWVGFLIGLTGLLMLIGPDAIFVVGDGPRIAYLVLLGGVICLGGSSILIRTLPPMPSIQTTGLALLIGGLALSPFGLIGFTSKTAELLGADPGFNDLVPLLSVVFLGVVLAGFGQTIRIYTIQLHGPVFFSITGYLIPIWATILGVVLLDEQVTPLKIVAFLVIVGGLLLAQTRRTPNPS